MYDSMVCAWDIAPSEARRTTPVEFWRWYNMRRPKQKSANEPWVKIDREALMRKVRAWRKAQEK